MLDVLKMINFNLPKTRKKQLLYAAFAVWFICVNVWIYKYKNSSDSFKSISGTEYEKQLFGYGANSDDTTNATPKENILDNLTIQMFKKHKGIIDIKKIDAHSTIYDKILEKHELDGILKDLSFQERCDLYISTLFDSDMTWYLDPNKNLPLEHRWEFSFDSFRKKVMNEVKEQYANENQLDKDTVEVNSEIEKRIKDKYDNFWRKTMESEQTMADYVSHLRIFNKCFITSDNKVEVAKNNKFIADQKSFMKVFTKGLKASFEPSTESYLNTDSFSSCSTIESRMYPWLSFNYPIYTRWTKEHLMKPPDYTKYVTAKEVFEPSNSIYRTGRGAIGQPQSKFTNKKPCFLNEFKNSVNGKGIVLSIGDKHVQDTVKLIHLLRALNNKYPIQVVYYDGLSDDSIGQIVKAAREQISSLPKSFEKVKQYFPSDYLNHEDHGLPKQEVWFVNVRNTIHDNFKSKFDKFGNKFLAAIFNSFEEYILVDADTIMVQNPEFFFKLSGYLEKGAYFFKDRTAPEGRPESDLTFFKKISPSIVDSVLFDIPMITDHTLSLDFFKGINHFMESGLVVINRNIHFNSILMVLQLNFFQAIRDRSYGDKEIFWLGFAINGDEGFQFNKLNAAAIGVETPPNDRLHDGKVQHSKEVCAAHPGHINGEDGKSLIWFNSGFQFCGQSEKVDYEKEFDKKSRYKWLKSVDDMKAFYTNPISLKHAIVPPFKDKSKHENVAGEPSEGWRMDGGYCNSYLWCAYSSIGGKTRNGQDNTLDGRFIEFDQKSINLFSYYGDIWVGNE